MTVRRVAPIRRKRTRGGFTLFEMLLVLVVLLTAAAMAAPSMRRVIQQHQLHQAVELLKVRLTAARVHAVESGLTYQFRFEPGGHKYLVIPSEHDPAGADQQSSGGSSPTSSAGRWKVGGVFSDAVHFDEHSGIASGGAGDVIHNAWLADLPNADLFQGVSWSAPIFFHPDGSSSGVVFKVLDRHDFSVTLSVRSLTGGVSVSPMAREGA